MTNDKESDKAMMNGESKIEAPFVENAAKFANNIGKSPMELAIENAKEKTRKLLEGVQVPKPIFYESMTQALDERSGARIRIWRKSETIPEYNEVDMQLMINKIPAMASMQDVMDIIASVGGVTAIELTDKHGNGAVAYYEW